MWTSVRPCCMARRPPPELEGIWGGRQAWVPRGASKALSCPAGAYTGFDFSSS
jgi:hypothetical protein